jgi:translation initiation factor 1
MNPSRKLTSLADLQQILPESEREPLPSASDTKRHDGKGQRVRVRKESHGRKGKTVTLVEGLQHNPTTMEEIARILKQHCGAGGTVKDGVVEVQGDQRARVAQKLRAMNYIVKES